MTEHDYTGPASDTSNSEFALPGVYEGLEDPRSSWLRRMSGTCPVCCRGDIIGYAVPPETKPRWVHPSDPATGKPRICLEQ